MLSGIYHKGQPIPEGERYSDADIETHNRLTDGAMDVLERLVTIAEKKDITLPQLSHAWLMQRPGITAPIICPARVEHVREGAAACDIAFTQEELIEIDEILPPATWVSDFYYGNTYARLAKSINHPTSPTQFHY